MKKIGILTFAGNPIACDLFVRLIAKYEVFIIYVDNPNLSFKQIWQRKRGGRWFLYNHLFNLFTKLLEIEFKPEYSWDQLISDYPRSLIHINSHNSAACSNLIKALGLDLGVLIGAQIIKPSVFQIPLHGMINLHQGHIPYYRGAPPAYWEHRKGEAYMYVTVHTVVKELDAGRILEENCFSISDNIHFTVSKKAANKLSIYLLERATEKILNGFVGKKKKITQKPNTVPGYGLLMKEYFTLIKFFGAHPSDIRKSIK